MNRIIYVVLAVAAAVAVTGFQVAASGQNMQAAAGAASVQPPAGMMLPKANADAKAAEPPGAPVQGPSWLKHLGLTVSQTQMGQVGGRGAVPGASDQKPDNLKSIVRRYLQTFRAGPGQSSEILNEKFMAAGSDLYRWNCQGCHGADGKGSAPEINSVVGPVQGTSAALTRTRMEARGIEADDDMINQVTELADASLRDRLQHGGKNMPSFEYLRADEVEALLGHLEKLADVPPTKRAGLLVPESAARAGEHIERGTCHICHDATGPGSGHMSMQQGTIPSLASIPRSLSLSGVVHQVQYGSCDAMKMTGGQVMPAYPYFTEEEIAAIYFAEYASRR